MRTTMWRGALPLVLVVFLNVCSNFTAPVSAPDVPKGEGLYLRDPIYLLVGDLPIGSEKRRRVEGSSGQLELRPWLWPECEGEPLSLCRDRK